MQKKYISADIETSGSTPGNYSMLSLGACVVGDVSQRFYRELKPICRNYSTEAMKVACQGLRCLEPLQKEKQYDSKSRFFNPARVLQVLDDHGETPKRAMNDFREWVLQHTQGYRPVLAAKPVVFDGMFIAWYFDTFCQEKNPFGHSGEDMSSVYSGFMGDVNVNLSSVKLNPPIRHTHNALEDAVEQALKFEKVLGMMREKKEKPAKKLMPLF
ncbi:hypothetical protein JXB28_00520 [Candidatus Woesearchaeota archaeon]|nr:hypothetical protein [Candidatus Woesearchaeota archaeon]